jgi:hypothetical protein
MKDLNYKGIKKFKAVDTSQEFSMIVLINFDFKKDNLNMKKILMDQVLFWMDGKMNIKIHDGNYVTAYLKNLADLVKNSVRDCNGSMVKVKREIENAEGYYPVNGEFGITLVSCQLDQYNEFEIEEIS